MIDYLLIQWLTAALSLRRQVPESERLRTRCGIRACRGGRRDETESLLRDPGSTSEISPMSAV